MGHNVVPSDAQRHTFLKQLLSSEVPSYIANPGRPLPSIVYLLDVPMSDFVPSHPGLQKVFPWTTT